MHLAYEFERTDFRFAGKLQQVHTFLYFAVRVQCMYDILRNSFVSFASYVHDLNEKTMKNTFFYGEFFCSSIQLYLLKARGTRQAILLIFISIVSPNWA